jgi:hypothetical protein
VSDTKAALRSATSSSSYEVFPDGLALTRELGPELGGSKPFEPFDPFESERCRHRRVCWLAVDSKGGTDCSGSNDSREAALEIAIPIAGVSSYYNAEGNRVSADVWGNGWRGNGNGDTYCGGDSHC